MSTTAVGPGSGAGVGYVVAIINTSPDTIGLLADLLERAGFLVVTTYTHHIRDGSIDLEAFLRTHRPRVIVYDIAPPYRAQLASFSNTCDNDLSVTNSCHDDEPVASRALRRG